MPIKSPCLGSLVIGLVACSAGAATFNTVGVYDANPAANAVDTNASPSQTVATFTSDVATAFAVNRGGVVDFESSITGFTLIDAKYGTGLSKTLAITSSASVNAQTFTSGTVISGTRGLVAGTSTVGDFTFTFGTITGAEPNEHVTRAGLTILSRNSSGYPKDVTVTVTFDNNATSALTSNISNASGADDTFYGFTAPAGRYITKLRIQSPGGTDPRVLLDDLAFITTVPEPTSIALLLPAIMILRRRMRIGIQC